MNIITRRKGIGVESNQFNDNGHPFATCQAAKEIKKALTKTIFSSQQLLGVWESSSHFTTRTSFAHRW